MSASKCTFDERVQSSLCLGEVERHTRRCQSGVNCHAQRTWATLRGTNVCACRLISRHVLHVRARVVCPGLALQACPHTSHNDTMGQACASRAAGVVNKAMPACGLITHNRAGCKQHCYSYYTARHVARWPMSLKRCCLHCAVDSAKQVQLQSSISSSGGRTTAASNQGQHRPL